MNKLLKKQRLILTYTLIIEALILTTLAILNFVYPHFKYYFYAAIGVGAFFILADFIFAFVFNIKIKALKGKTETTSAEIIGNDVNEAYNFGQIGLAVCDKNNNVMWVNDFLGDRFRNIVDKNIYDVFPGLFVLEDENQKKESIKIAFESHTYQVQLLKEAHLFVFKDVTDFENIFSYNQRQAPVVGYISIDNYSDVQMSMADDAKFADMLTNASSLISDFASSSCSLLRKIKDDRYLFVTTMDNYEKMFHDKFSVVDKVRSAYANGFTLSIGVSYGFPDYSKLADLSSSALDVALSRGGDQTVIAPFSQSMIYLGGKSELKPSRNRVKMRTISNSFLTILRSYKHILIMGHTIADFDAIGSSLGIFLLCKYVHVPAKIAWEDQLVEDKCRVAIKSEFSQEEMEDTFIDLKNVDSLVSDDTLLVMCDHNNPTISMFPETVKKMTNVAIVDHHRPGQVSISNPVFNGVDSSASSTSELITSYITYSIDDIPIDARTATFLLAGIALDTHFFKEKATNSTFEAASQLKNYDADSAKVEDFLKENFEEYKEKIAILNTAETPYYGTLVASGNDEELIPSIMLSIVANEAIQIRGINSAFCIGKVNEHEVKISARSDGSVNCQMLMEKLGGGGHFTMAACSFMDVSVQEVKKRLNQVLADYLDEAKVNDSHNN
ncbi:MAG: DHH family phosphoesterase [Bacilli bacterium]